MLDYTECFSYDGKDGTKKNEVICGPVFLTYKSALIWSSIRET